jgi:hypothetical protein
MRLDERGASVKTSSSRKTNRKVVKGHTHKGKRKPPAQQSGVGVRVAKTRKVSEVQHEAEGAKVAEGFDAVVRAFAADPEVTPPGVGKGFGSRALKANGKIFAMISSKGEFVVKLPHTRTAELVTSGRARYFDAGRGKPMKEWAVVIGGEQLWLALAKEAREFH